MKTARRPLRRALAATLLLALSAAAAGAGQAGEPPPALAPTPAPVAPGAPGTPSAAAIAWSPLVTPKLLSNQVEKGLAFLVKHQLPDGGWGQGEESAQMGNSMRGLAERANVADTCVTTLALMRAGSTPQTGPHAAQILRGLDFLLGQVERSDADSLSVTDVNGTRVQGKLGPYIDTFMASLVLAEAKGQMPDPAREQRLERGLAKVLHKIERNQRPDGGFDNAGWAPVLAQAMAGKGMNKAAQKGAAVSGESRKRFEAYAARQHDAQGGGFRDEGSAGVGLYAAAASVNTLWESSNTRAGEKADAMKKLASAPASAAPAQVAEQRAARVVVEDADRIQAASDDAQGTVLAQLNDPSFVQGFGSNGGEEFLSYMLLAETLVSKGGKAWADWDKSMTANLNRVQNGDGSWSGHHCITGRNFVTAAALLVLTADRATVPLAAKIQRR